MVPINAANSEHVDKTVAVIMAVYNEKESWVRASVESILGQTYADIHFYIVLDNPENEDLKRAIGEYAKDDERISFSVNECNIGLVKSLNSLLAKVGERYVARMDADDISYPTRIERELDFLHENELDFVMSGDDLISEGGEVSPGRVLPLYLPDDMREVQKYANVAIHPTWLLKSEVYRELGGYRNIDSCEDLDFVLRALKRGFRVGRMPDALIQYRFRSSGISYTKVAQQSARARFLRSLYRSGADIEDSGVEEEISGITVFLSSHDSAKVESARHAIDELSMCLYERRWGQCIKTIFPNIFFNRFFREMFVDGIWTRIKIAKYGVR